MGHSDFCRWHDVNSCSNGSYRTQGQPEKECSHLQDAWGEIGRMEGKWGRWVMEVGMMEQEEGKR